MMDLPGGRDGMSEHKEAGWGRLSLGDGSGVERGEDEARPDSHARAHWVPCWSFH